jgi:predicted DNA-binding transcriptional regulator YafY
MNRIDRLFAITVLLQGKGVVRAQDLAEKFEVSKRTIYRDIAALSEMGVPVVALPGEGYELMAGFYLPPLIFTPDEAGALFLGAQMLINQAAGRLPVAAEHALAKLVAALPAETNQQVQRLTEIIRFVLPRARFNLDNPQLVTLQRAIREQRVIWLQYHSYSRNEITEREVEPHQLFYNNGTWYLEGYCRLRQDIRAFRLERMDRLTLLPDTFIPYVPEQRPVEKVAVQVRFEQPVVRWVQEWQHSGFIAEEAAPDGSGAVMTYQIGNLGEIIPWLLSWGASAEVLSPLALRQTIRAEALKLADKLA